MEIHETNNTYIYVKLNKNIRGAEKYGDGGRGWISTNEGGGYGAPPPWPVVGVVFMVLVLVACV